MSNNPLLPSDLDSFVRAPIRLLPNNFTYNMWGGDWIPHFKNLPPLVRPVGESWEFSAHRDHPNRIHLPNGQDVSLIDLISGYPAEILGRDKIKDNKPTFLLKFIDSRDDLSVQVHPSDEDARRMESDTGKSEAWYILESSEGGTDGFIYLGFNPDKAAGYNSQSDFEEAFLNAILQANSQGPAMDAATREKSARLVLPFLNKIRVKAGEAYRVGPGTVHSIGRGVRLFEIQETSDITYRLWDWNRPDAEKLKESKMEFRPLHLEKAKKVIDFTPRPAGDYLISRRALTATGKGDIAHVHIISEAENRFSADLISLNGMTSEITLNTNNRYCVLTGLKGSLAISFMRKGEREFRAWGELGRGRTVLIPASVEVVQLTAQSLEAEAIKSYVPA